MIDIKELPAAKGDIKEWLRRRAGNDLVMMGGQLAGEIADHIEQLEAEIARLRKDADRWLWARDQFGIQSVIDERYGSSDTLQEQDILVDKWIEIGKDRDSDTSTQEVGCNSPSPSK